MKLKNEFKRFPFFLNIIMHKENRTKEKRLKNKIHFPSTENTAVMRITFSELYKAVVLFIE